MSSIWEISSNEGLVPPAPTSPPDKPGEDLFEWKFSGCDMRPLLIKSMKEGYLLDRKYWARRSREGGIEPIYFSGAVAGAELPRKHSSESLDPGAAEKLSCTVLERHWGRGGLLDKDGEGEHAEDSDYEDEPEPAGELASENISSKQRQEQRLFPVLKVGSSVA